MKQNVHKHKINRIKKMAKVKQRKQYLVLLDLNSREAINEYAMAMNIGSKSNSARILIMKGLMQWKKEQEAQNEKTTKRTD